MRELEVQWELFPEIPRTSAQAWEGRRERYSGGLWRPSVAVQRKKNLAKKRGYIKPCSSRTETQRGSLKALYGGEKTSSIRFLQEGVNCRQRQVPRVKCPFLPLPQPLLRWSHHIGDLELTQNFLGPLTRARRHSLSECGDRIRQDVRRALGVQPCGPTRPWPWWPPETRSSAPSSRRGPAPPNPEARGSGQLRERFAREGGGPGLLGRAPRPSEAGFPTRPQGLQSLRVQSAPPTGPDPGPAASLDWTRAGGKSRLGEAGKGTGGGHGRWGFGWALRSGGCECLMCLWLQVRVVCIVSGCLCRREFVWIRLYQFMWPCTWLDVPVCVWLRSILSSWRRSVCLWPRLCVAINSGSGRRWRSVYESPRVRWRTLDLGTFL